MQENAEPIQSTKKKILSLPDHFVVGIGASAESLMDELLAKHTKMEIFVAEEGMRVKPNCVYLIPNKQNLTIKNNKLRLTNKDKSNVPNYAIDTFLTSLAQDKGHRAVAVILSGTGTDGTKGIAAIKDNAGLVIAQDPLTAKFDGMPNSAIISGYTDYILPPEMMAEKILQYPRKGEPVEPAHLPAFVDKDELLKKILNLVKENTPNDFTAYKRQTLERRITKKMAQHKIDQPEEYLHYLENNPDEIKALGDNFLIGVTKFFRDSIPFQVIQERVIPAILSEKTEKDQTKIWITACSTGEEVYSMAILFSEYMEKHGGHPDIKIFATDIDPRAIEVAAKGLYPAAIEKDLSEERLAKYFTKEGKKYCIASHIRKMVIFAQHNLLKDPPFSKIDLASCRNMLIYMQPELQKRVLSALHFSLNLGGYLFLGSSESSGILKDALEPISKKWNIYKTTSLNKSFVLTNASTHAPLPKKEDSKSSLNVKPSVKGFQKNMSEVFNEAILEEFGYAALFVDENYEFRQALGDYKRFLTLPDKKLELNLLKMVPRQLSVALGIALRKASRCREKVVSKSIEADYGDTIKTLSLVVKPYLDADQFNEKFLFVLIKEEQYYTKKGEESELFENQVSINRLTEIEAELRDTKQSLQTTVEELETSNEELQSTNEELQSLNEELHTVNTEHQLKIRELSELNDDMNNYFRSTEIGKLFVDKNLLIRKYSPAVARQINIIEADIGRPISHFSFNTKDVNLIETIRQVIKTREIQEQEIQLEDGRYYQMRILPYIRQDKTVDGAVVTFVNITTLKTLNNMLTGVLDSSLNGIMAFDSIKDEQGRIVDFEWVLANSAVEHIMGKNREELIGHRLLDVLPGIKKEGFFEKYVQVMETGRLYHAENQYRQDGLDLWLETVAIRTGARLTVTFADIGDKKRAEEEIMSAYQEVKATKERLAQLNNELEVRVEDRTRELSDSEERFRLVSLASNDAIWDWNLVTNELWWNEAFKEIFGYEEESQQGIQSWFGSIHPDDRERVVQGVYQAINQGEKKWSDEYRFMKADGSSAFVYNRAYVLKDENDVPYRMLGSLIDLTDLKKAQDELKVSNENLKRINTDLDNFVYTASHDLKSPIANLESLLKPTIQGKADAQEWKVIELIDISVGKLRNTVKALADIAKVQKDLDTTTELLSFSETVKDVKEDIHSLIEASGALIHTDFTIDHRPGTVYPHQPEKHFLQPDQQRHQIPLPGANAGNTYPLGSAGRLYFAYLHR